MSEMLLTAYDGAILGPIAKLLGWLMSGVYSLMEMIGLDNVGLSTIIFTIIIYSLMFPLTYKQQKFSKLSQKAQPELQAINKKYQNKKDQASMMAMQEETQAVYEKYGISMSGSCVQMLIQMPILFALYRVFYNIPAYLTSVKDLFVKPVGSNAVSLVDGIMSTSGYQDKMSALVSELKIVTQAGADFTVTDAATLSNNIVDVTYKLNSNGWNHLAESFPELSDTIASVQESVEHVNTFLCYNISDTPWQMMKNSFESGHYLLIIAALMIPLISYLTQVFSTKMAMQNNNSANKSNENDAMAQQMAMMNKTMPIFSLVICFTMPVGLGIYWIASALVRIVQQFALNKHFEKVDLEDIIKKNQEKAKKKREKMGIAENQISNAARMNTKKVDDKKQVATSSEKEQMLEKAEAAKANAKPGSMAAKANMVREFNERNDKEN